MKSQPAVTSAFFPAVLAAAAISLAILLFPAGGSSVGSAGLAPALKLVAGGVVTVVQPPAPPVGARPRTVVHRATRIATTPQRKQVATAASSTRATPAPAHHPVQHSRVRHTPAPRKQTTRQTQPTPHAAARPVPTPVKHGNGKALGHAKGKGKALGRLGKATPSPAPASHGKGHGRANGHNVNVHANAKTNANVHGNSAHTRHGPPAVPPGHAYGKGGKPADSHGRGGGK